jgi:dynactin complex subunit
MSIIGIALIIFGTISGRRKKEYAQPKQQYDSLAQDRTKSQTQYLVPSNRQGKLILSQKIRILDLKQILKNWKD